MRSEQIGPSTKKTRGPSQATLALREAILRMFRSVEKPVTVRQAFYQLSVTSHVDKSESGYRKVQRQLLAMRRDEWVPYGWIADNTRWRIQSQTYSGLDEFLRVNADRYRHDLWQSLPVHAEVWVEKDALAGVLHKVTGRYQVPLLVARGFSSETFCHESAQEIAALRKPGHVYYLGDFDPSGWVAGEDLKARLQGFCPDIEFTRLAINADQVSGLKWAQRPTKAIDTRTRRFYERFGYGTPSIELDAVHPDELRRLVQDAIERHIPAGLLERVEREEKLARESLTEFSRVLP